MEVLPLHRVKIKILYYDRLPMPEIASFVYLSYTEDNDAAKQVNPNIYPDAKWQLFKSILSYNLVTKMTINSGDFFGLAKSRLLVPITFLLSFNMG